jgi:hypothetical protein
VSALRPAPPRVAAVTCGWILLSEGGVLVGLVGLAALLPLWIDWIGVVVICPTDPLGTDRLEVEIYGRCVGQEFRSAQSYLLVSKSPYAVGNGQWC